jgi:hypothetical protein
MIVGRCGCTSLTVLWRSGRLLAQPLGRRARPRASPKGHRVLQGLNMIPRFDRPLHGDQQEVDVVFAKFSRPVGRRAAVQLCTLSADSRGIIELRNSLRPEHARVRVAARVTKRCLVGHTASDAVEAGPASKSVEHEPNPQGGRAAEPVAIKPRVCLNADKQVLPTLLTRPTSFEMTHPQSVRVPLACHSKPWE